MSMNNLLRHDRGDACYLRLTRIPALRSVVFCLCIAAAPRIGEAQLLHIDSTVVCPVPVVRHDSLLFTLDLYGAGLSRNYWYFFDSLHNAVVIELFDAKIDEWDTSFPSDCPFRRLRARTADSKMSITGRDARLLIAIDRKKGRPVRWSARVDPIDGGLTVTIGKTVKRPGKRASARHGGALALDMSISLTILVVAAAALFFLDLNSAGTR